MPRRGEREAATADGRLFREQRQAAAQQWWGLRTVREPAARSPVLVIAHRVPT